MTGHEYIVDRLLSRYTGSVGDLSEKDRWLLREAATVIKGRDRAIHAIWKPIDEDTPMDRSLLLWCRPINDDNPYAEAAVIGQISSYDPGKWWNGLEGMLQDIWHVTHWKELPTSPRHAEQVS